VSLSPLSLALSDHLFSTEGQTLRRASLVYYQSLHLEMSRYLALARSARFNLGPRILGCLDARTLGPEERMVLQQAQRRQATSGTGAPQIGEVFV
jgi:hypothetical protein